MKMSLQRLHSWYLSGVIILGICGCGKGSPYDGIPHLGEKNVSLTYVQSDTLRIDGRFTSLSGEWFIRDSVLLFIDRYSVGVKEFTFDGQFTGEHIRQGRGPDELISPAFSTALDETDGSLVFQDSNCWVARFDRDYRRVLYCSQPWFAMLDSGFSERDWSELYLRPDPETPEMYEYNYICERNKAAGHRLYIPVTTEHTQFNGFEKASNSRRYWCESYIFISFNPDDIAGTRHLFGHYPPAYRKRNIPVFGDYDFCLKEDGLIVSFAADPNLYIIDYEGNPISSFGSAESGIKGDYPSTKSFREYEDAYKKQRSEYGHYGRIARCGGYVFRTCRLDGSAGSILQIYEESSFDLVGRIPVKEGFEVIGECGGTFLARQRVDLDKEEFVLVKFRLKEPEAAILPASGPDVMPGGQLAFIDSRIVQYGDIRAGETASASIRFENSGSSPLTILKTYSTCNCTSASTDSRTYAPGQKGVLNISIDTEGKHGPETIVVRVLTDASSQSYIARIELNVI
ncbi:MAG: DUF1573 domain-containing protein [Candidatus Cryptobacteroides sp.]